MSAELLPSRQLPRRWYSYDRIVANGLFESMVKAAPYAHGVLLDIGCGTKPYSDLFRAKVTRHIGVDWAAERLQGRLQNQADVYADVSASLPFASSSIDTVLCTEVLEHIPNPQSVVKEIARVLAEGGTLILTAPQVWGLHEEPHDYYRFTRWGLSYLVVGAGLHIEYVESRGGIWATIGQRMSSFIHGRLDKRRNIATRLLIRGMCLAATQVGIWLDRAFRHEGDTLGNTLVAIKKSASRFAQDANS